MPEVTELLAEGARALDSDDAVRARPLLEQAFQLARDVEDFDLAALAGLNLARALCVEGNVDRAQDLAIAALSYFADCQNRGREVECLLLIGDINLRCEDLANAARCYDLSLRISEQLGADAEVRVSHERIRAMNRQRESSEKARANT